MVKASNVAENGATTQGDSGIFENTKLAMNYLEASEALGIKVTTLQKLVAKKEIPFVKIGRLVRFVPAEISAWLKQKGV